jgi:hypothetical protein
MAGVKGRSGGNRPTAPQNNPANVSATGGNGQSGQPKRYISGMPYGQGQALMQQQAGAPMQQAPQSPAPAMSQASLASLPQITPITDPTQLPEQPITDGAPVGPGANSVANLPQPASSDPDIEMAREYYPLLQFWASQPGASQSTKDYVLHLGTLI